MPSYAKLKGFLAEKNIQQQEVADLLSMSRTKLNLILNGKQGRDFSVQEMLAICEKYKIYPSDYFF